VRLVKEFGLKPLEGIRVLDLTHVYAGPFCTQQLAALGAEVVKIESRDHPDMTRQEGSDPELAAKGMGLSYLAHNAGKRSLTLNLKTEKARGILCELVAKADVFVQNFAGETVSKLGCGPDIICQHNPRLIYCQLSGFGRTGPLADFPAYDNIIQAYSGMMTTNGWGDGRPLCVGPPVVDYGAGFQAMVAILAGLVQREKTGKGLVVDVSMLDTALLLMSDSVAETLSGRVVPEPLGNRNRRMATYGVFATRDGQLAIGAWTNRQAAALMRLLGNRQRADSLERTLPGEAPDQFEADTKWLEQRLLSETAVYWERFLNEADIPAARVRQLDEAVKEEQLRSRKLFQTTPEDSRSEGGPEQLLTTAFSWNTGYGEFDRPPARLGADTDHVLGELGYSPSEITALIRQRII